MKILPKLPTIPDQSRRRFCAAAAAALAAVPLRAVYNGADDSAGVSPAMAPVWTTGSDEDGLRPFRVQVSEAQLADLRRRIRGTRWPDKETVADRSQGPPLDAF